MEWSASERGGRAVECDRIGGRKEEDAKEHDQVDHRVRRPLGDHVEILPDEDSSIKERIFSESELVEAEKKYESLAIKSASWVPFNALSPAYNIGDWCEFCEFKSTCLENR